MTENIVPDYLQQMMADQKAAQEVASNTFKAHQEQVLDAQKQMRQIIAGRFASKQTALADPKMQALLATLTEHPEIVDRVILFAGSLIERINAAIAAELAKDVQQPTT